MSLVKLARNTSVLGQGTATKNKPIIPHLLLGQQFFLHTVHTQFFFLHTVLFHPSSTSIASNVFNVI